MNLALFHSHILGKLLITIPILFRLKLLYNFNFRSATFADMKLEMLRDKSPQEALVCSLYWVSSAIFTQAEAKNTLLGIDLSRIPFFNKDSETCCNPEDLPVF